MGIVISLFAMLFLTFFGFRWYKSQAVIKTGHKKSKASKKSGFERTNNPYRCVEIAPCLGACEAVKTYRHIKILLDNAPALPIRGCDYAHCECKFIRHDDRRNDDRREKHNSARQVIASMQTIADDQGNRANSDRRKARSHA